MKINEIMQTETAALVEYYNNSPVCAEANRLTEEVKALLGADAPVYRVNVEEDPREADLARIDAVPVIIIYRNKRREWVIRDNWPTAEVLAARLQESEQAPGAINPLKGHPRH